MMKSHFDKNGIHCSAMIFHTEHPLPGMKNLGASLYEPQLINKLKGTLTFDALVLFINDALHLGKEDKVNKRDIIDVQVCPDDHAIWLVHFKHNQKGYHRCVNIKTEAHIPSSPDPKAGHQALLSSPEKTNFNAGAMKPIKNEDLESPNSPAIAVGIIDTVAHNELNFNSAEATHADVLAKIIKNETFIKPVSIPMSGVAYANADEEITVFDLICALSRKSEIDKVQLLNISIGYQSQFENPILKKIIQQIDKPVICSAGNDKSDNDTVFHWPSNWAKEMSHVIAVTSTDDGVDYANFGKETVDLTAPGSWGEHPDDIRGTSFATAWVSRMFALAFSREGRTNMSLHDVDHAIEDLYLVQDDYIAVPTKHSLRFSNEKSRKRKKSKK